MAIIVTEGSTFEPHPEGQFAAVCCDVVEKRDVPTAWGPKTKIRIVFQTEDVRDTGKPNMASRSFNASLAEASSLRPFLEAWRGKKFTTAELKGFDMEHLVGVQAVLQIVHEEKGDRVYDNITAIMCPMKGMAAVESRDYVRMQDRPEQPSENGAAQRKPVAAGGFDERPSALDDEDDGMPF